MTKRKHCFSMLVCLLMLLGGCAPASPQEAAAESTVEISDFCGQRLEEHMNACGYRDYQVTASSVAFRPAAERYLCLYH